MGTVPQDKLVDWERFGSYDHTVWVLAWIYRFINNLRARDNTDGTCLSESSKVLHLNELAKAETCLVELGQKESYPTEHKILSKELKNEPN